MPNARTILGHTPSAPSSCFHVAILLIAVIVLGTPGLALAKRGAGSPASVPSIRTRAAFDRIARVYHVGRGTPMPHAMFVIDRASRDAVHYVDSRRFRFHKDFLNATYLTLERGDAFYSKNYSNPNRRFILGTIAYQVPLARFTFEFFEGDRVEANLVALSHKRLSETFFAPVSFKANSDAQAEAASGIANLRVVRASDLFKEEVYLALDPGTAFGVLRVVERVNADTIFDRNEIVILKETPVSITPVSAIISVTPPAPLAHLNVLARTWKIPNIYAKGADLTYASLVGKYVRLDARTEGYEIRIASQTELQEVQRRDIERRQLVTPKADLEATALASLSELRASDAIRYGAKAANLGELVAARVPGIVVPNGFAVPFSYYAKFAKATEIEGAVFDMLDDQRFNHDVKYRRERLAAMRDRIVAAPMPEEIGRAIVERARRDFGDAGLFVRSSTNAEDLPGFSGAGLYTTVPNVKGDEALLTAVKTVWASIWNDGAYEARQEAGMSHFVYPGVLVQLGMNADAAGVLVTTNPFNKADRASVYVNAKRGLGIRVVDGHKVPEQIVYNPARDRVRVITRSADDTALTFAPDGGVREVTVGRAVLSDALVRRLAKAAGEIERRFKAGALDIEWLTIGETIYIVQVRPYQER
jgi:hypothetical protein